MKKEKSLKKSSLILAGGVAFLGCIAIGIMTKSWIIPLLVLLCMVPALVSTLQAWKNPDTKSSGNILGVKELNVGHEMDNDIYGYLFNEEASNSEHNNTSGKIHNPENDMRP